MDELLRELIEFVQQASPMIWETLVRQVYVQAMQSAVWSVFWLLLVGVSVKALAWFNRRDHDGDLVMVDEYGTNAEHALGVVFSIFTALVASVLFFYCVVDFVSRLANPDYYAIQLILEQLR